MMLYFVNHTKKEYVYVGEGEDNDITFVFTVHKWSIKDDIRMVAYVDEYSQYVSYKNLEEEDEDE